MNQNICLHAINSCNDISNIYLNKSKLKYILRDNAILSRRMLGLTNSVGFNGIDYISLCDYQKRNIHPENHPRYTSYESYIRDSLSIVFPKDKLEIINPTIIDITSPSKHWYNDIAYLGMSHDERYSDLSDEVQVKNQISLDLMCGITIPFYKINHSPFSLNQSTKIVVRHLTNIKKLLLEHNHNVPIYDIDTMYEIKDEEDIKKLVKKYY